MDTGRQSGWSGVGASVLVAGAAFLLRGRPRIFAAWWLGLNLAKYGWFVQAEQGWAPSLAWLLVEAGVVAVAWVAMLVHSWGPVRRPRVGLAIVLGLVFLLQTAFDVALLASFTQGFRVGSNTLYPALRTEGIGPGGEVAEPDIVFLEDLSYRFGPPARGDIIVFSTTVLDHPHVEPGQYFVKRVAALPGETVRLDPPRLFVDGQLLAEPPVFEAVISDTREGTHGFVWPAGGFSGEPALSPDRPELTLGPDEYLLLGDNSRESLDSRHFGPVPLAAIRGRVVWRILPPERFGPVGP